MICKVWDQQFVHIFCLFQLEWAESAICFADGAFVLFYQFFQSLNWKYMESKELDFAKSTITTFSLVKVNKQSPVDLHYKIISIKKWL